MDDRKISYFAFEGALAIHERIIKRLIIALIVCIIALGVTNLAWLYAWTQYDYTSTESTTETTYSQDGNGVNIIGDDNDVTNKDSENNDKDANED